ncbi:MAG: hypothetical protein ACO3EO_09150, partial [Candidatus Kapaibacteriota bacterium]
MRLLSLFICISLMLPLSIIAKQDKSKQDLQAARQVLAIMKEQMQQLTERFKKNTLTFKGQYEQQT